MLEIINCMIATILRSWVGADTSAVIQFKQFLAQCSASFASPGLSYVGLG